ncbi:hypothetical protein ACLOJK_038443 [Asimina triloba]
MTPPIPGLIFSVDALSCATVTTLDSRKFRARLLPLDLVEFVCNVSLFLAISPLWYPLFCKPTVDSGGLTTVHIALANPGLVFSVNVACK